MIVVAVRDRPDPAIGAGASPRGYAGLSSYAAGSRAVAAAADLARDYSMRELSAWSIEALRLRCMVFALGPGQDREAAMRRLALDSRVQLVQPLQEFDTYTSHSNARPVATAPAYNDPYLNLQHGLATIGAATAQQWSRGSGIRIALIDTGLDAAHPDLRGRVRSQRDFVEPERDTPAVERHGTEVAGVIAAVANNRLGIVGVAPDAQLHSYRACWAEQSGADAAHCNSYTLALALGAAIGSDAQIINLSLGGPADPLLTLMVEQALARGKIVVGAVPPSRRMDGFPIGVAGVIAVASTEDLPIEPQALNAPGHDVLTLVPGGHFDYASGSSLAAAHVSGAIALLLSLKPRPATGAIFALLDRSQHRAETAIDICSAAAASQTGNIDCTAHTTAASGMEQ